MNLKLPVAFLEILSLSQISYGCGDDSPNMLETVRPSQWVWEASLVNIGSNSLGKLLILVVWKIHILNVHIFSLFTLLSSLSHSHEISRSRAQYVMGPSSHLIIFTKKCDICHIKHEGGVVTPVTFVNWQFWRPKIWTPPKEVWWLLRGGHLLHILSSVFPDFWPKFGPRKWGSLISRRGNFSAFRGYKNYPLGPPI